MVLLEKFDASRHNRDGAVTFNTGLGIQTFFDPASLEEVPPGGRDYRFCGSKSTEAFKLSVKELFARSKSVYMWSFTFADVPSLEEAARRWKNLCKVLVEQFGLEGLRVLEKHPGGHGVHYHALFPRWFPVRVMRRAASRCGFGRINVIEKCGSASYYLSKHFSKTKRPFCFKGVRLWAAFGGKRKTYTKRLTIVDGNICSPQVVRTYTRRHRSWQVLVKSVRITDRVSEIFRTLHRHEIEGTGKKQLARPVYLALCRRASEIFGEEIVAGRKLYKTDLQGGKAVNLVFN
jgi:hypothetical protein